MLFALFRPRRSAAVRSRGLVRRHRGFGGWEALGSLRSGLAEVESLESRIALAADLATEFVEPAAYYVPGSPARYVVTVVNLGTGSATDVAFSTNLASQFTSRTWTAVYSGGATGPRSGSGNVSTGNTIDLPMGGEVRFTIDGIFTASATGNAVSSATATVEGEVDTLGGNTANNTREQAAQAIAMSDDASGTSGATVRMVDPVSGAERSRFTAYAGTVRGVQTVMADMDNDGRPDIVTAPLRGGQGEIRVFTQDGVELAQSRLRPFGPGWGGGLSIAVGDFDGDGLKDIAAAKATGDGEVRVFRGQAGDKLFADMPWQTIRPFGAAFLGGARLAAADMGTVSSGIVEDAGQLDGRDELIIVNGPGAAPLVRIYDMSSVTPTVVDTVRPFAPGFVGGVSVETARINADGIPDLIVAAGRRGNAAVEVHDGRLGAAINPRLQVFTAIGAGSRSPAATYATAVDADGDGRADAIFASQGAGGRSGLVELNRAGGLIGAVPQFTGPIRLAAFAPGVDPALIVTASGLQYRDLTVGNGTVAAATSTVNVTYKGTYLDDVSGQATLRSGSSTKLGTLVTRRAGEVFDSGTQTFAVGNLIRGWIEGIPGMRVGGRRQLIVPAELAYGANGTGDFAAGTTGIPPNATLVFDIELRSVS